MSATAVDLAEVTKTTDIVVDGHTLWVRPGFAGGGRFWQLLTPADVRVGMVVERDGAFVAVFEPTVTGAIRLIVTGLCNCGQVGAP